MSTDLALNQQRLLEQYFAQSIKHFPNDPVILSEGDSWFSYPGHANTIDHLDDMFHHDISLLRLEKSGDTIHNMTTGSELAQMRHLLTIYDVDALLFSGGGNDVVGPELVDLFTHVPPGDDWRDHITPKMDFTFQMLEQAYTGIALLRDQYRPNCLIVTHGYAYVQPSGKPTKFWLWPIPLNVTVGPWIRKNLELVGIDTAAAQTEVVKYLIDRFNEMLQKVATNQPRFVALDNRSTLGPNDWSDELHPTRDGFKRIAKSFYDALKKVL